MKKLNQLLGGAGRGISNNSMTDFKFEQKQFGSTLALGVNFSHLRVAFQKPAFPTFPPSSSVPLPSAVPVANQLRWVVLASEPPLEKWSRPGLTLRPRISGSGELRNELLMHVPHRPHFPRPHGWAQGSQEAECCPSRNRPTGRQGGKAHGPEKRAPC